MFSIRTGEDLNVRGLEATVSSIVGVFRRQAPQFWDRFKPEGIWGEDTIWIRNILRVK
jgi:hypothetical protein